jgi:hypothetical protein
MTSRQKRKIPKLKIRVRFKELKVRCLKVESKMARLACRRRREQ